MYLLFIVWHSTIITILALKYYNWGLIKLFLNNNNILINIIYQYVLILKKYNINILFHIKSFENFTQIQNYNTIIIKYVY